MAEGVSLFVFTVALFRHHRIAASSTSRPSIDKSPASTAGTCVAPTALADAGLPLIDRRSVRRIVHFGERARRSVLLTRLKD
jgi:hypothetical protein